MYALTTQQLQVGGERDIEPIKCMCSPHSSYRWRGERDIEPIKCMRSPHTSYRWRERDIEPIKCMRSPHTATGGEERVIANQVYAPTHTATGGRESSANQVMRHHTQLQVERVIVPIKVCAHHTPATGGEERGHRANQVYVLTTQQLQVERRERQEPIKCMRSPHTSYRWRERVIVPIKCMRSPHTSYRWRGERHRANKVYALTTHQLQVERRERHRANQVYALATHQLQVERRES